MPISNLFKKKKEKEKEKEEIEIANQFEEIEEDENELIAVISAAVSMILNKPVSGFKVVSFKKRGNWKNII